MQGQSLATMPASGPWNTTFAGYEGDYDNDALGQTMQFLDINSDGKLDIISGASNLSTGAYTNNGSVFVIPGQTNLPGSGAISSVGFRINGNDNTQYLGQKIGSLSSPPIFEDFNSDGFLDPVNSGQNGYDKITICYGKANGSMSAPIPLKFAAPGDPLFATNMTPVDLNGDGKLDLLSTGAFFDGWSTQTSSSKGLTDNGALYGILNQYLGVAP